LCATQKYHATIPDGKLPTNQKIEVEEEKEEEEEEESIRADMNKSLLCINIYYSANGILNH